MEENKTTRIDDRINDIIKDPWIAIIGEDSVDKLIAMAYIRGRRDAAREVCDKATEMFANQRKAASKERYHNVAKRVLLGYHIVYSDDYDASNSGYVMFADDDTQF